MGAGCPLSDRGKRNSYVGLDGYGGVGGTRRESPITSFRGAKRMGTKENE